jgi:hypothetical protein
LLGDDGNDNEETEGASAPPFPAEAQVPQPQAMYFTYDGPSLESLDQKGAELDSLFEDGDIDLIEYTRERDALMASRDRAEMVADHNAAIHQGVWKSEQITFFLEHPEYRENPVLNLALRHTFKDLDHEGNSHLSGLELLNEARKQVEQHLPGGMVAGGGRKTGKADREAGLVSSRISTGLRVTNTNGLLRGLRMTRPSAICGLEGGHQHYDATRGRRPGRPLLPAVGRLFFPD